MYYITHLEETDGDYLVYKADTKEEIQTYIEKVYITFERYTVIKGEDITHEFNSNKD